MKNEKQHDISRRIFLQGVGGDGAFLGMAGLAGRAVGAEPPRVLLGQPADGLHLRQRQTGLFAGKMEYPRAMRPGVAHDPLEHTSPSVVPTRPRSKMTRCASAAQCAKLHWICAKVHLQAGRSRG